jgi:hypothetical protein
MLPPQEVQAEIDPLAAAVAGLAGGAAFVAVLEADIRLTGNNVDDLIVLGRPFVREVGEARKIGLLFHLANSVLLAGLYAKMEPLLPGPPWLKGVIFANVENVMLYPITLFEDVHPAIKERQVDRYFTWASYLQSVPRHIAYGAVLGAVYAALRREWRMGVV